MRDDVVNVQFPRITDHGQSFDAAQGRRTTDHLKELSMSQESIIDQIFATFRAYGGRDYGERVSVLEHSLQAAYAAEQDGAAPQLVAAAVLHDYGHLIHDLPENVADQGIDSLH